MHFLKQYPIRSNRKRKYEQEINTYAKKNTDHIRVSHKTRQMIKLKAYVGIHEYHDHFKFDSDYFPIVMDTGASCAISIEITDFIEIDKHKITINGLDH